MKRGIFTSIMAFATALLMPVMAWADGATEGFHHGGRMWGGGGHMFYGPVMMIITVAVIAVIVVLAVRWMGAVASPRRAANRPRISSRNAMPGKK